MFPYHRENKWSWALLVMQKTPTCISSVQTKNRGRKLKRTLGWPQMGPVRDGQGLWNVILLIFKRCLWWWGLKTYQTTWAPKFCQLKYTDRVLLLPLDCVCMCSLNLCMCYVHVFMWGCIYMHLYTCVFKPEVSIRPLPRSVSTLLFKIGFFTVPRSDWLG